MDLGLVIVSYNTRQLTAACLESVYGALSTSDLQASIVVVDNASSDGSAAMIRRRFTQATLIDSEENLGFARATNLGIDEMATSPTSPRYILLLNPDTIVSQGALPLMVSYLDRHPQVGVVGPQLSYADGSFQHGAFHFPTLWMAFFDFWTVHHRLADSRLNGRYPRRLYASGQPFPIDHPLGAALMIRWETIQQVGLLDGDYFMYCEEIDWCMRVKAAGWQVYCVPQAKITHLAGQSTQRFRDEMFIALWRSRYRLFEKHYGQLYQRLTRLIVRAGLRRRIRETERATRRGNLTKEEGEQRVAAYRQVMEM